MLSEIYVFIRRKLLGNKGTDIQRHREKYWPYFAIWKCVGLCDCFKTSNITMSGRNIHTFVKSQGIIDKCVLFYFKFLYYKIKFKKNQNDYHCSSSVKVRMHQVDVWPLGIAGPSLLHHQVSLFVVFFTLLLIYLM